jgi:hypothetical protein
MISTNQPYELGAISNQGLPELQETFANLPEDTYAEKRLRSRRYSCFLMDESGNIKRHNHKEFMQSKNINDYLGDVQRKYEEIEDSVVQNPAFVNMFKAFREHTGIGTDSVIEVHQLRWHCGNNVKMPAPEGNHQDGFDFIGMYAVNMYNVDGGDIMIFKNKTGAPCFKKRLEPGEFVVLNDRDMFHNAAPLVPTPNDDDGYWDLIVLTANKSA